MKYMVLVIMVIGMVVSGCSQKEMSDGASDIGSDISDFGKKIFKVRE